MVDSVRGHSDEGVAEEAAQLFGCHDAVLARSSMGVSEPGRLLAQAASGHKDSPRNFTLGKLGCGILQDADEAVIKGDGDISGAGRQWGDKTAGNRSGDPENHVQLTREQFAVMGRDGVVIQNHAAGWQGTAKHVADRFPGGVPYPD